MRYPVAVAFLLLTGCLVSAQMTSLPLGIHSNPRESSRIVVNDYCRLDYVGMRLRKDSWERIKPLTTWKSNPDWQGFTVVAKYEVQAGDEGVRSASVNVRYAVLGHFDVGLGYISEPHQEEVSYLLKEVDGEWKINVQDPPINPHVSKQPAIAWLKASLAKEKDAGNKAAIEKALKDLGASQ